MTKAPRFTPRFQTPPASAAEETDDDLGIGVEDDAPGGEADPLAALLADPRMAERLDALIAQRMAQMAAPAASGIDAGAFDNLAKTLGRMIELNAIQQPGYVKPLPADEVERRLAGKVEMESLLAHYRNLGLAPKYTVGEGGFFECTNAIEIAPGSEIRTFLPPPEDFIAENEPALEIMEAQRKWLGVPTAHIGEQVEAAMKATKMAPLIGSEPTAARPGLVEIIKGPPDTVSKTRRSTGTVVKEPTPITTAERASGVPVGPFAHAEA